MCGRFSLTSSGEVLAEFFELADAPDVVPRYNIAPTQPAPVVRIPPHGSRRRFDLLFWGLVPSWAQDPGSGARMINARAETIADKPSFRAAFERRRCLVIADGFYEWQAVPGMKGKQPYYIRMSDGSPLGFAGLWEHWAGTDGSELDSCTIITTEPNELLRPLHNRMPVILRRRDFETWLDPKVSPGAGLRELLVPYSAEEMTAYPVGRAVGNPANDTPECVKPRSA